MKKTIQSIFVLTAIPLVMISCKKADDDETQPATTSTLEVKTYSNLFANDSAGHYTFYNLRTNSAVGLADSATSNWDLAFRGTTILTNSGTSGPGSGGAVVVQQGFDDVTTADNSQVKTDNGTSLAVPTGSGNGWYNYDPVNFVINPVAGRTIVVRTADGKFGKVEILSYYKDAPAVPTSANESRYYSFRVVYQPDGSNTIR